MRLLVIGGTVFAGRHLVERALKRGHQVTLFNRGQTNPELFPEVEKLRGDRASDLSALEGRTWDAAIDTSGYLPQVVGASASLLAKAVEHYTFISSISVYRDFNQEGMDEAAPLGSLEDETVEEVTPETYGPLKVLCEAAAEQAMPGRVLVVRPGLIVGPYDPTDRFTYWPYRVAQGGEVLAPDSPAYPVQFIDARDLADWILRLVEVCQTGIFNATGPAEPLAMSTLLETCKDSSGSDASFTWVAETFLLAHSVQPWTEMPLWVPRGELGGFGTIDVGRAIAQGLTFRPLAQTVADTLAWAQTRPADHAWRAGLDREREKELLTAWHTYQG